jgi:hypothetical protein
VRIGFPPAEGDEGQRRRPSDLNAEVLSLGISIGTAGGVAAAGEKAGLVAVRALVRRDECLLENDGSDRAQRKPDHAGYH